MHNIRIMKNFHLFALFTSLLILQNCIKHDSGGVSTNNILLYSGQLITESPSNDGTFDETITVTLKGSNFYENLTEDDFGTRNLPNGLNVTVTRESETKAKVRFFGQATTHSFCSNGQMFFFFKSTAFTDGQLPISFEVPIDVQYISPVLTYSGHTLTEDATNDGSISNVITVNTNNGGTFARSSGIYIEDTDYTITGVPAGLTAVLTANSNTQATLSFTGNATEHTPVEDVTAKLKWNASALSSDFCAILAKKDLDFEFYRSVLMYSVAAASGNLLGSESSARAGADALCEAGKPALPDIYDGFRAYITIDVVDDIDTMDNTYGIPSAELIESLNSTQIGDNWADLLDGSIDNDLDTADVATGDYWTGSLDDGTIATNHCNNWTSDDSGDDGNMGNASATDGTWLNDTTDACDQPHSILCVAFVTQ